MTGEERLNIRGIVPVLVAPFDAGEELDLDSLRRLVEFSVAKQLPAVCLPAYASEFYKLSLDERYALVEAAVEASDGRLRVVAQSNHYSAKLAAEIAKRNEELGAGAISVAPADNSSRDFRSRNPSGRSRRFPTRSGNRRGCSMGGSQRRSPPDPVL